MLKINGKTFMNLQEAVQWLLDNNALPFQSSANYIANTEIGLGTIVNPSPAKVRIGSLIFFADSKVSTVIGLTENGFICSDQYNNLVDDIPYVTNVAIDASGHLITTLSDGQTIDAGQIKQVTGFSIDGSQHLIVSFNDGTSADLGAIFNGNVNISGTLNATAITGDSIIENMTGYSGSFGSKANLTITGTYLGVCKNGNKVTFVAVGEITRTGDVLYNFSNLADFIIPLSIGNKLYPVNGTWLSFMKSYFADDYNSGVDIPVICDKSSPNVIDFNAYSLSSLTLNTKYYFRIEQTFLLSDSLAS